MKRLDLDAIRRENPLPAIAGKLVALRQAGAEFKACCPFHADRSPSFTIFSGGQRFHCFGCGAAGDVLDFVQRAYAVTLPEADPEAAQRRIRTNALREHARAMDAIYTSWEQGYDPSPDQIDALQTARTRFDEVRPYGWRDAEAAYKKDHSLVAREQCDFGFGAS